MKEDELFKAFNKMEGMARFVNIFLGKFLNSKKEERQLLLEYFKEEAPTKDGFKIFNLTGWYGNDINPTIELVQVGVTIKFGMTSYGRLRPLTSEDLGQKRVRDAVMEFFNKPLAYYYFKDKLK